MVYNDLNYWGKGRELPKIASESFNEMWKKNKVQGKGGKEMSSKEEILVDIRKNTKRRYDYPVYSIHTTVYPDKTTKFLEVSDLVGGEAILLEERQDINDVICEKYPTAKKQHA